MFSKVESRPNNKQRCFSVEGVGSGTQGVKNVVRSKCFLITGRLSAVQWEDRLNEAFRPHVGLVVLGSNG